MRFDGLSRGKRAVVVGDARSVPVYGDSQLASWALERGDAGWFFGFLPRGFAVGR
jgi:hypothetical protein